MDRNGNVSVRVNAKAIENAVLRALSRAGEEGGENSGVAVVLRVDAAGRQTSGKVTFHLSGSAQKAMVDKGVGSLVLVVENPNIRIVMARPPCGKSGSRRGET